MDLVRPLQRLMGNQRTWRIFLLLLFLVPVLMVLPHMRSLVVRNAVVTSFLSTVRAPIDGQVHDLNVTAGSKTEADHAVLQLQNVRQNRSELARLQVIHDADRKQVATLQVALASVRALADSRRKELTSYASAIDEEVSQQLKVERQHMAASEAAFKEAEQSLNRARELFQTQVLSQAEIDQAESRYYEALAARTKDQMAVVRLQQQVKEVSQGVYQIDVPDGVLLTRQMSQQMELEVLSLENRLRLAEAALSASAAELQASEIQFQLMSDTPVVLPPASTIWDVHTSRLAWVQKGDALMSYVNCANLMIDIAVDDATLELIAPGQAVNVRLFGSFNYHPAEVILVRGSSGIKEDRTLAAEAQRTSDRDGRVLARFIDTTLADSPKKSCAVGRVAYAEFEGISLLETILFPLFR